MTDDTRVILFSSALAGLVGRLLCHPLDTCKARIQAPTFGRAGLPVFSGIASTFLKTLRTEGIAGLYRGFPAVVIGGTPAGCPSRGAHDDDMTGTSGRFGAGGVYLCISRQSDRRIDTEDR